MSTSRVTSRLATVLSFSALMGTLWACSNNKLALAELAQACVLNSDCISPDICAFETCHAACMTSADCASGSQCVTSGQQGNVCQAPILCTYNTQCPGSELCGPDGQCRVECQTSKDCVSGQDCVGLVCADPNQVSSEGGLIGVGPQETALGAPCSYNSDCKPGLFCPNGTCAYQCKEDVDCDLGQVCVSHVCALPSTTDGGRTPDDASLGTDAL